MNFNRAIYILNLSHDFNYKELKRAYHKKSLETHPDKNNLSDNKNDFIMVKDAYEYLQKYLKFNEKQTKEQTKKQCNDKLINDIYNIILHYLFFYFNLFYDLIHYNNIDRVIVLKPSICDVLLHNFYKININDQSYYLPLWYNNIIIKNECIINIKNNNTNHFLFKNKIITKNNIKYVKKNIIFMIYKNDDYYRNINNHYDLLAFLNDNYNISTFKINIKNEIIYNKNQILFKNCGCSMYPLIYTYKNDTHYSTNIKGDIVIEYI